jgi:hypothetical protein
MIQSTTGGFKFPDNSVQTTAAKGGLSSVNHDTTLMGNGTSGSPLGVAQPLVLNGPGVFTALLTVNNGGCPLGPYCFAIVATGGSASIGMQVTGGFSDGQLVGGHAGVFTGGEGFPASGGLSLPAGDGIYSTGGSGNSGAPGGNGVTGIGGNAGCCDAMSNGGYGVYAAPGKNSDGTNADAAFLDGNVDVSGTLHKSGGSFKIDHPLDPANKYLYHSFVESPDMMNVYNGNIVTDGNGLATVTLPDWFEALNRDFRYQLTVIGQFAQAIVASEIQNHEFTIRTDKPSVKVSWQVTGVRQDAWANSHRIPVEEEKTEKERGYYLHPELYNEPVAKSVQYATHPELMRHPQQPH